MISVGPPSPGGWSFEESVESRIISESRRVPGTTIACRPAKFPVNVEVVANERGEPRDILVPDFAAMGAELVKGGVHAARVPEHDAVQDKAERSEPVFHPLVVALIQLALLAVEDMTGEGVAAFLEVADALDMATVGVVIDIDEDVQALEDRP